MTYAIMQVKSYNQYLKFNRLPCFIKPTMRDSGGTHDHACQHHGTSTDQTDTTGPCAIGHLVHLAAYHGVLPAAHAGTCLHSIRAAAKNSNHLHT